MSESPQARTLIPTKRFERAYHGYVGRDSTRLRQVETALDRLRADMFDPRLKTHHLGGQLFRIYSCSCGYDCRILFKLIRDEVTGTETLLLMNVGTHDEVY